jgi:hypothetical protein
MVTVETISIVFTGLSVSLAAVYYIMTLRNTQRNQQLQLETRQAQLFSFLMDKMDSVEWWQHYLTIRDAQDRTYDEWIEIIRDPLHYGGLMSIVTFFNHIGWLVKKGLIELETVRETMSPNIIRIYENTRSGFDEYERRTKTPQRHSYLEFLYEQVKDSYYQAVQDIKS